MIRIFSRNALNRREQFPLLCVLSSYLVSELSFLERFNSCTPCMNVIAENIIRNTYA
jgi:hypothetical protein